MWTKHPDGHRSESKLEEYDKCIWQMCYWSGMEAPPTRHLSLKKMYQTKPTALHPSTLMPMARNKTISNYARTLPITNSPNNSCFLPNFYTIRHFCTTQWQATKPGYVVTSAKCAQIFVFEATFFRVICKGRGCLEVLFLRFKRKKKSVFKKETSFLVCAVHLTFFGCTS